MLTRILTEFRQDPQFMINVAAWRTLPAHPARYAAIPAQLHPTLHRSLKQRGMTQLYSHQAQAVELTSHGQNIAIVTPTASGKTLCYNLPILDRCLKEPQARALYLFPTKALAQDQLDELSRWKQAFQQIDSQSEASTFRFSTYDGDTSANRRAITRRQSQLILTNPDMLHSGILPYHASWADFFTNLRYVVLDELHTYRGVFGSHVANVLRRLQRICVFYGSQPQFICTSATIANPQQLAEDLLEQPITVVQENGAPRGEKHVILYNPPCYDPEQGLRRSSLLEAQSLASKLVVGGLQTILFGRSRLTVELLLTYLRERVAKDQYQISALHAPFPNLTQSIRGYRGGYLPTERREIEAGLRDGTVRAVVATNALELGIDIGQLQAAVLCGYPGSIASTWQQIGRVGRTTEASVALIVATGSVLDQYLTQHANFLFGGSPEHALINANNLMLMIDQLRCSAFELPFQLEESFGRCDFTTDALHLLTEQGDLQLAGQRFFWVGDGYPSRQVGLRSMGGDTLLIQVEQPASESMKIIGEVDAQSAPFLLHEGAIYIHEGRSYWVKQLDFETNLVTVSPKEVDYYTNVSADTSIDILEIGEAKQCMGGFVGHGELQVCSQVVGYRRIKRFTHENLGTTPLDYPPEEWETNGYWIQISPEYQELLTQAGQWRDGPNAYGPNWQAQRQRVRERDGYCCTQCQIPESPKRQHDVHHVVPFRTFGYVPGLNELYQEANQLSNLLLLCRSCHRRLESAVRVRGGLDGLAYTLHNIAPLHLMCDRRDISVAVDRIDSTLPTIYIYENIMAGLGFGARLFELHNALLQGAQSVIEGCACQRGCPSCVGPVLDDEQVQLETKRLTLALLGVLRTGQVALAQPTEEVSDLSCDVSFGE